MLKRFFSPIHPTWPFYAAIWGIVIGLILGVVYRIALFSHFVWLIVGLLLIIVSLRFSTRFICILAIIAGSIIGCSRASSQFAGHDFLSTQFGQTVTLTGRLSDDPDLTSGNLVVHLRNLALCSSPDSPCLPVAGQAYITLSSHYELERSDYLTLAGKLNTGFGTFAIKMTRPDIVEIRRSSTGDIFARFKHWFADRLRLFLPSPEIDLGLGYLMGQKSGLSADFSEALRTVGMTHVVVASGAHLAILTAAARRVFGKISRFAGLLFSLLLIAAFVLIVDFTPSMTRAALVAILSLLAGYVGRQFTPLRLLALTAMLTLFIDPGNFFALGWQLSFASFFGILILAPRLQRIFYGGKTPPWLATMLITSAATLLSCAPLLIYNFGALSLLAFIANLIILPTLPLAMLLLLLVGISSFFSPLAALLALPARLLLGLHIFVINFLSQQTTFVLAIPAENPFIFLLYLPILLLLIYPFIRKYVIIILCKSPPNPT